jgi:hypothetical protein
VSADPSSPIPPAFDQLREHREAVLPEEVPGLLERLGEVPDPRDPRGVRHALVVVLSVRSTPLSARGVDGYPGGRRGDAVRGVGPWARTV